MKGLEEFTPLTAAEPENRPGVGMSASRLALDSSVPGLAIEALPGLSLDNQPLCSDPFAGLAAAPPENFSFEPIAGSADASDGQPSEIETGRIEPQIGAAATASEADRAEAGAHIILPAILDQAESLRANLLEKIGTDLVIDASAVTRIDTPCVEVAISAARQWFDDGFSLTWTNASSAFTNSLGRLGLSMDFLENEGVH